MCAGGQIQETISPRDQLCQRAKKTYRAGQKKTETATVTAIIKELRVKRVWDPYEQCEWLAFEMENGIQIRQGQYLVADTLIKLAYYLISLFPLYFLVVRVVFPLSDLN